MARSKSKPHRNRTPSPPKGVKRKSEKRSGAKGKSKNEKSKSTKGNRSPAKKNSGLKVKK